jgi:hypothetical protein
MEKREWRRRDGGEEWLKRELGRWMVENGWKKRKEWDIKERMGTFA